MFSEGIITWLQQFSAPWLDQIFLAITALGTEQVYLILLLLIYWCINRRTGRGLILAFLLTVMVNAILKDSLGMARPSSDLVRVLGSEWSAGFPSGHAQFAATVWGYLAFRTRNRPFRISAAVLVFLLALSRLYLGLHFLGDVLGGIALGLGVVVAMNWWEQKAPLSKVTSPWRTVIAVVLPFLGAVLVQSNIGFRLAGVWVGFLLTDTVGRSKERNDGPVSLSVWARFARAVVGLTVFAGAYLVTKEFVPQGLPTFLAYAAMATWVTAGAPTVFGWLRLGDWSKREKAPRDGALASPAFVFALCGLLAVGMTFSSIEWSSRLSGADASTASVSLAKQWYLPKLPLEDTFLVLGHKGAEGLAPANTIVGFGKALQQGADVLELDVRRTKDGQVVVIHDASVGAVTNGEGPVTSFTLEELQALDAGYWFTQDGKTYPYRGAGLQVPTLAEVLAAFPDAYLNIDMKDHRADMPDALLSVLDAENARDRVIVASFDGPTIRRFRTLAPDVATALAQDEMLRFVVLTRLGVGAFYNPPARYMQVPIRQGPVLVVTPHMVELAQRLGIDVHVWTINDRPTMRSLLESGVQGIVSDYPNRVAEVLAQADER